jgi:hypothetical protein
MSAATNLMQVFRSVGYAEGRTALRGEIMDSIKEFGNIPDATDAQCREMILSVTRTILDSFSKDDFDATALNFISEDDSDAAL